MILDTARRVLQIEADSIREQIGNLGPSFVQAVERIASSPGRLCVTGLGKSGLVGQKIAATLASTGTPAYFLHAAEASHGDLGMLVAGDVVLALSASGESPEIVRLLEFAKTRSLFTIAMTGAPDSSVARAADLALSVAISREACPWGAPLAVLGEPPARFPGRPAARVRCNALFAAGSLTGRAGPLGAGWLLRLAVPALPLRTAPEFVVAALAVSLAVGLAAGVTPARRAAGLDPVDALRAE